MSESGHFSGFSHFVLLPTERHFWPTLQVSSSTNAPPLQTKISRPSGVQENAWPSSFLSHASPSLATEVSQVSLPPDEAQPLAPRHW